MDIVNIYIFYKERLIMAKSKKIKKLKFVDFNIEDYLKNYEDALLYMKMTIEDPEINEDYLNHSLEVFSNVVKKCFRKDGPRKLKKIK